MKTFPFYISAGITLMLACGAALADDARLAVALENAHSKSGGFTWPEETRQELLTEYHSASAETKSKIERLPQETITGELVAYLTAKEKSLAGNSRTNAEFGDFKWENVGRDWQWQSIRLQAVDTVPIREVTAGPNKTPLHIRRNLGASEPLGLAIPCSKQGLFLSVVTDKGKVSWTMYGVVENNVLTTPIDFPQEGCRVDVKSIPAAADVYFNGNKFHRLTDVKVARDAGPCKVKIQKEGYEPSEAEKDLVDGETWEFKAELKPIHKKQP